MGLFDLHGNLFEWSHDWFGDYGVDAITDPLGAKEGSYRVFRGGSWNNDAANCRSAYRDTNDPTNRASNYGFRLALSPSGVTPEAASVQESGAIGRRHGGSVCGAATGDAVAGWRSGLVAVKRNTGVQGKVCALDQQLRMT